ncbi:hypothetical protein SDRG_04593 [Saprolegnia diclina VS20]|uniref:Uncharacterized protein n=1 Tax=Saprolegnia diclina (strain VS20) TaxID=1156394 RepID=T0QJF4_SAPDV|nr:hypothetical protein SDRG_04593 [Saprolegnia diclina VS20]EQC38164.1 hypothetical protein SDRG_04593 [Saprolegnia diclina VS20]|eukprot:XP_008608491.1 hypothetical protein SDRG_04593 [Saprolegnia diclina VS20]
MAHNGRGAVWRRVPTVKTSVDVTYQVPNMVTPPSCSSAHAVLSNACLFSCMTQYQGGLYQSLLAFQASFRLHERPLQKGQHQREAILLTTDALCTAFEGLLRTSPNELELLDLGLSVANVKADRSTTLLAVCMAAALGDMARLERYHQCTPLPARALVSAAKFGQQAVTAFLISAIEDVSSMVHEAFCMAAREGHLSLLTRWAPHVPLAATIHDAIQQAAARGHLEVALYLLRLPGADRAARHAIKAAIMGRHVDLVYALTAMFPDAVTNSMLNKAVVCHDVALLQHLMATYDVHMTPGVWYYVGLRPHLAILHFLKALAVPGASNTTFDRAAALGSVEILALLHDSYGLEGTVDAMTLAASAGNLDVVAYLTQHHLNVGCTTDAMDQAADHGHLHVVQYLHTHRDEGASLFAIDGAAASGHLHVVRFLCENRVEGFSQRALPVAQLYGHDAIVNVLQAHQARLEKVDDRHMGPWVGYAVYGIEF